MRFVGLVASIVGAVAVLMPAAVALGQPGFTEVLEMRLQAAAPPAQPEILEVVLDFAPGAWTPLHTHGGPVYVTVIDGTITVRQDGSDTTFAAGDGWAELADEPHLAGNDTSTPVRVVATFVLPKGATPTTVAGSGASVELPPGPTTFAQHRFEAPGLPAAMDVVHRVVEIAPGSRLPRHSHPGITVVTGLLGSATLTENGETQALNSGESWVEPAGFVHGGTITADGTVRLVIAHLVPRGAAHTVPAEAPAPAAPAAQPTPAAVPAPPAVRPAPAQVPVPVQLPGWPPAQNPPPPDVPTEIRVPAGHVPFLLGHATGTQNYVCQESASGFVWTLAAPAARLVDDRGREIMTHYAGPTWEANGGSTVVGARVDGVPGAPGAIDWLLLRAASTTPGQLLNTTFIQRVKTTGGLAPASGCTAATVGTPRNVPYTADYYFYRAG